MRGTVVVAHPSPDLYGADLQLVQTVRALVGYGWRVVVAVPQPGPLVPRLEAAGAEVVHVDFPVLRKSSMKPGPAARLLIHALASLPRAVSFIRRCRATVLLVNTVTLPWWSAAGRFARVPVLVHLHEAETEGSRLVRRALLAPVRLATGVIVISEAALQAMSSAAPSLRARARLVYNGVDGPEATLREPNCSDPIRLVVVGRLSPRKAPHVALEAVALLRAAGRDIELELAGTAFEGYEWYEESLRARAAQADLSGSVYFSGYCSPVWPVLERATVVLAPSTQEPFGNVVVEAQLARRAVVAASAQGHRETVEHEVSGLLVTPGDPQAMAAAVGSLLDDPVRREALVDNGRQRALQRFSTKRYGREIQELVEATRSEPRPRTAT